MDAMYPMLVKAHAGFSMLLLLLALVSMAMAAFTQLAGMKGGLMTLASGVGIGESAVAGLAMLTGLVLLFGGPWPVATLWAWFGLVAMVIYSILSKRLTRPARQRIVEEGASAMPWIAFTAIQVVLVIVAFAVMKAKPF